MTIKKILSVKLAILLILTVAYDFAYAHDVPLAMADTTIGQPVYAIDTVDQELPVEVHQVDLLVLRLVQRDLMIQLTL